LRDPNYFLYVVGSEGEEEHLTVGNCGIGRTSLSPGIHDARWGTMMVAPYEYVWGRHHGIYGNMGDPKILEKIILSYFKPPSF